MTQQYLLLAVAVVLFMTNFLGLGFTIRRLRRQQWEQQLKRGAVGPAKTAKTAEDWFSWAHGLAEAALAAREAAREAALAAREAALAARETIRSLTAFFFRSHH